LEILPTTTFSRRQEGFALTSKKRPGPPSLAPDELRGIALFAATPEQAEAMALEHLGLSTERT
jgi:hypothetical protein